MKKAIWIIVALIVLIGGYLIFSAGGNDSEREPIVLDGDVIDFAEVGNVTFNNPGAEEDVFVLVYEAPGQPALTRDLRFDSVSRCLVAGVAELCGEIALEEQIVEKRVTVEGVATGEGVLVRKLSVLREGEEPRLPDVGSTFITWDLAVRAIENCDVEGVMQTHALDVYLTMKDGTRLRTISPRIDDVFGRAQDAQKKCGDIWVATE